MPLSANLPAAIVETILASLATLFLAGAGGDTAAARDAAVHMLAACHPGTEDELRLAANIVGFSFHALEALGQAAAPDIPMTRVLRLRGGAVSLSREAAKAERRLAQLQKARHQRIAVSIAKPEPAKPEPARAEPARAEPAKPGPETQPVPPPIQDTVKIADIAKAAGVTWTRAYENRQRDIRIAASLKRAEARIARQTDPSIEATRPGEQPAAQAI